MVNEKRPPIKKASYKEAPYKKAPDEKSPHKKARFKDRLRQLLGCSPLCYLTTAQNSREQS
jgi:hypothetical protein